MTRIKIRAYQNEVLTLINDELDRVNNSPGSLYTREDVNRLLQRLAGNVEAKIEEVKTYDPVYVINKTLDYIEENNCINLEMNEDNTVLIAGFTESVELEVLNLLDKE